ncbi:polysaccharide deacetylase family protein [Antarcticibacterium sp. 1MA-6-2]|uniref:polysaccharide deacetylase family protein n=1 Tax=Antarcticibacterium sp. 1MA-6-2 TaxID=2908210 RepID=UPI001F2C61F9|nr:polysaccharide deacetylase family protein [Antarcticibacterium sp. 1MA-6-2]UJH91324.1 polysaccharide deacetylase family protein [Antarcticibacterium sp. 1MA-6-2]
MKRKNSSNLPQNNMKINKEKKDNGGLIISLDFELLWGVFDVVDFNKKREYFENTRRTIPKILDLFKKYKIKATWATVGMLFNQNWEEWEQNIPTLIPKYNNQNLSAYEFGKSVKSRRTEELCFAPDLIKLISDFSGQEIATHTYSHYYCLEPGQTKDEFSWDIKTAISMADKFDLKMSSLVFPRNQLKPDYLEICQGLGVTNVRSNPSSWYWKDSNSNSLFTKIARTGDAYAPLGKKSYSRKDLKKVKDLPLQQKASRFLRPVESNEILRKAKLQRIMQELEIAAKNREYYHLWWHPHNFGEQPRQSLEDLEFILKHYSYLHSRYEFLSENMEGIGKIIYKS